MSAYRLLALLPICTALLTGCPSGQPGNQDAGGTSPATYAATASRAQPATQAELDDLARGLMSMAVASHALMGADDAMFSVQDMAATMAILGYGAEAGTLQEFSAALGLDFGQAYWPRTFGQADTDMPNDRLVLDGHLWAQAGYPFTDTFESAVGGGFSIPLSWFDFTAVGTAYWQTPSDWAENATDQQLSVLFGNVSESTRLVVARSVLLDFDPPAGTTLQNNFFNTLDNEQYELPMLHFQGSLRSYHGDDLDAVEWTDDANPLALLVLMPRDGRFDSVQADLAGQLATAQAGLAAESGDWWLPVFEASEFDSSDSVSLGHLSMAFGQTLADFSRINGSGYLFLHTLEQRSEIGFQGTHLRMASATVGQIRANPQETSWSYGIDTWNVDLPWPSAPTCVDNTPVARPFLYFLIDRASGMPLATGRVMSPDGTHLGSNAAECSPFVLTWP